MNALNTPVSAQVLDAAIAWQLRLDGNASGADRDALARWLAAKEEHARAWQQLGMLDQRFGAASTGPARKALLQSREGSRRRLRSLGSGAACLALAIATVVAVHERLGPTGYWLADLRTDTGEQRVVNLDDGTVINLNTHSAIDVRFTPQQRLVVLREGEILVETGHKNQDQRPFIVETDDGRMRALGTRFVVRREDDGTRLGVLKSAVAATPERGAERVLKEGEQVLMHRAGLDASLALSPGSDAWTRGMLVVDNVRLADLVNELSRYRRGHLGVAPQVADLRITGSFPITDTNLALKALPTTLPVQVEQRTGWWVTVVPAG